jgi:hypothetical protein
MGVEKARSVVEVVLNQKLQEIKGNHLPLY